MKLYNQLVIQLLLALLLSGAALAAPIEFTDGTGRRVAYGQDAWRIVSLAPNVTEMLYFLGLGERVSGRSTFCDYPPPVLELPSVGGLVDTSLERIVGLKPDLVVAYQGNSLELVEQLRRLGIEVLAFSEAATLDEIGAQMGALHRVVAATGDDEPEALRRWRERLEGRAGVSARQAAAEGPTGSAGYQPAFLAATEGRPTRTKTVFYGMPGELVFTAAAGSFIHDLIRRAGGRNVVPAGAQRWPQIGAEFILAAQPDWLLISTPCAGHTEVIQANADLRAGLYTSPVWRHLTAVRDARIVVVNADVLLRPGPRILDALDQLARSLEAH